LMQKNLVSHDTTTVDVFASRHANVISCIEVASLLKLPARASSSDRWTPPARRRLDVRYDAICNSRRKGGTISPDVYIWRHMYLAHGLG
jgi:hypothetical protein